MSIKSIFESQLRKQQTEVARQALGQALNGPISSKVKMSELIEELRSEELLWQAFISLSLGELKEMMSGESKSVPGPTRKRGVTSQRIVDFVAANPGCRRNEVMAALGLKGGTVSSQLRMLRVKGRLQVEGDERDFRYRV